jgi:hypothetical protein
MMATDGQQFLAATENMVRLSAEGGKKGNDIVGGNPNQREFEACASGEGPV